MAFCEKCGANLAEGTRFCDKCGAPVNAATAAPTPDPVPNYGAAPNSYAPVAPKVPFTTKLKGSIPAQLQDPKNQLMFWIGLGSLATIALSYLISMFLYIPDMCEFIGRAGTHCGIVDYFDASEGASSIWMIIFMALNLIPLALVLLSLKDSKYRLWSVFAAAGYFTFTIIALISWGIMDPITWVDPSWNKAAWFVLMDCLSEMWYIKLLIPAGVVIGYGVDYIVNKAK